jgi:hypothetical protein
MGDIEKSFGLAFMGFDSEHVGTLDWAASVDSAEEHPSDVGTG